MKNNICKCRPVLNREILLFKNKYLSVMMEDEKQIVVSKINTF